MKSGRGPLGIFDGLTDRILCVLGAVLLSQGPEFMQQYLQRLGGHLDEARRQVAVFQQTASRSDLTLEQFIRQTSANPDTAVAKLGGVMTEAVERATSLQTAYNALLHAAPWTRPFIFLRHLDPSIVHATASFYKPAVPTTAEGLAYALAGMLIALAIYHWGFKWTIGWIAKPHAPAQAPA